MRDGRWVERPKIILLTEAVIGTRTHPTRPEFWLLLIALVCGGFVWQDKVDVHRGEIGERTGCEDAMRGGLVAW